MLPIHTILCPLDFSEPSHRALQVAIEMASHFKAELLLGHFEVPKRERRLVHRTS